MGNARGSQQIHLDIKWRCAVSSHIIFLTFKIKAMDTDTRVLILPVPICFTVEEDSAHTAVSGNCCLFPIRAAGVSPSTHRVRGGITPRSGHLSARPVDARALGVRSSAPPIDPPMLLTVGGNRRTLGDHVIPTKKDQSWGQGRRSGSGRCLLPDAKSHCFRQKAAIKTSPPPEDVSDRVPHPLTPKAS